MKKGSDGYNPIIQAIRKKMEESERTCLSFYEYMKLCLYHPNYGYYMRENRKIGKDGDFYTAASIGSVMGRMLASYIKKVGETADRNGYQLRIEEWGGGDGTLALHTLDELKEIAPKLMETLQWISIEKSDYHRTLQKEKLKVYLDRIHFAHDEPPSKQHVHTIVLANELIDAFPVYRIKCVNGTIYESFVAWDDQAGFYEQYEKVRSKPLIDWLKKSSISLQSGQIAEINTDGPAWLLRTGKRLAQATVILIDYGDAADEYFAAHRMTGTLMCYHRHTAHDNPFIYAGEQDLTTLVNFTDIMQAAETAGFKQIVYKSQKQFLIDEGIMDLLSDHVSADPFSPAAKMNRAVRQILLSDRMSERFKVLTMQKGQL